MYSIGENEVPIGHKQGRTEGEKGETENSEVSPGNGVSTQKEQLKISVRRTLNTLMLDSVHGSCACDRPREETTSRIPNKANNAL